jgi:16S rRNA (cytidine1402-2'-O)-methyltransferase
MEKKRMGALYLVPTPLSADADPAAVLPRATIEAVKGLDNFVVENEKSAMRFLSRVLSKEAMSGLSVSILDEHSPPEAVPPLLGPALLGENIGLLSEAGCPAVADPGAALVRAAHDGGIEVIPLGGSSAIVLALMASGMNGQEFRFHGYLPRERGERVKALRRLERTALETGETQIYIETPYRNKAMIEDMGASLGAATRVCVAWDLGGPGQRVASSRARDLGALKDSAPKLPCTFLIGR